MLFQQIPLQGAGIHADADHRPSVLGRSHYFRQGGALHVSRIDPESLDPRLDGHQGQTVSEVNVGDQGKCYSLFDPWERRGGLLVGYGHPDDLAALARQSADLGHRAPYVPGIGGGHGLHRHRGVPAHGDFAQKQLPGFSSGDFRHCSLGSAHRAGLVQRLLSKSGYRSGYAPDAFLDKRQ